MTSTCDSIIERLVSSGQTFALYRLPGEREPHLVLQRQAEDDTPDTAAVSASGFLMVPFVPTKASPSLLIRPDVAVYGWELIEEYTAELPHQRACGYYFQNYRETTPEMHHRAERTFRYQMNRGHYQMLHLATSVIQPMGDDSLAHIFLDAAAANPHAMVYLLYTRQTGRWWGICPSLLLRGAGRKWHTSSLMGANRIFTQQWDGQTQKAQSLLTDFIEGNLQQMNAQILRKGPYTFTSGTMHHLCTDFTFTCPRPQHAQDLLQIFFPSPATAGIPAGQAHNFVRLHEHQQRLYYGGYLGPINLHGETCCYLNTHCHHQMAAARRLSFSGTIIC